jgi:hypothetical protein
VLASYAGPATSVHNLWDYFVTHSIYKHFTFLNVTCIRAHIDERTVIFDNDLFDVYLGMPPSLRLGGPVYRQAIRRLSPDLASAPSPRSGHRVDLPLSFYLEWALTTGGGLLRTGRSLARAWGPSHATAPDPDAADTEGSWPDMNRLIRHHAGLQQLIRDTIRDRRCLDPEIFDVGAIEGHLKEHLAGRNLNDLLLAVLTFGRWHRKYGP